MPPKLFDRILKRQGCPAGSRKKYAGAIGSGAQRTFRLRTVIFKHCLLEFDVIGR